MVLGYAHLCGRSQSLRFYYIHHNHLNDLLKVSGYHFDVVKAIIAGDERLAAKASDAVMDYTENKNAPCMVHFLIWVTVYWITCEEKGMQTSAFLFLLDRLFNHEGNCRLLAE